MKKYERAVARGVRLLDKVKPTWWNGKRRPTIDLKTLDLGNTCNCTLGQVYRPPKLTKRSLMNTSSGYEIGLRTLGLLSGGRHGFDIPASKLSFSARRKRYGVLGQRWREVIRRRRRAAARKATRGG